MVEDLEYVLFSNEDEDDRYKLAPYSKCGAHLLNLVGSCDADSALNDSKFKDASRSAIDKLQSLFNKQSLLWLQSEAIKEYLSKRSVTDFEAFFSFLSLYSLGCLFCDS